MARVTIASSGQTFDCATDDYLLDAALEAGLPLAYNCRSGACGMCKAQVITGNTADGFLVPYALEEEEHAQGIRLMCCVKPGSEALTIAPLDESYSATGVVVQPKSFSAQIAAVHVLTPTVRELELALPSDAGFRFLPGMYVEIAGPGTGQTRAYSLVTTPLPDGSAPTGKISIQVARHSHGLVSGALHHCSVGDRLTLRGPYGGLPLGEDGAPVVMLGGGTGVAPLLSLAGAMLREQPDRDITLVFSVRDHSELFALDRLDALTQIAPRFRTIVTLTRAQGPYSDFHCGRIGDWLADEIANFEDCAGYIAGSAGFVDAGSALLRRLGVAANAIHQDKFVAKPVFA